MPPKKNAEVTEANTGMQKYYLVTGLIFALLSFYCSQFYMTWETYTCLFNDEISLQV